MKYNPNIDRGVNDFFHITYFYVSSVIYTITPYFFIDDHGIKHF